MAATSVKPDERRRLVVVEDDPAICEYLTDLLSDFGFAVVCMTSDREAYARLPTLPGVAALVVDINLGAGTTGFDVARFARQLHPHVPVIYVTGEASRDSFRAFGVPDSAYVAKPFTAEDLLAIVRTYLPAND